MQTHEEHAQAHANLGVAGEEHQPREPGKGIKDRQNEQETIDIAEKERNVVGKSRDAFVPFEIATQGGNKRLKKYDERERTKRITLSEPTTRPRAMTRMPLEIHTVFHVGVNFSK